MLILAMRRRSLYSAAISSRIGAIILQGPHHSAQKSSSTGLSDFRTSCFEIGVRGMHDVLVAHDEGLHETRLVSVAGNGMARGGNQGDGACAVWLGEIPRHEAEFKQLHYVFRDWFKGRQEGRRVLEAFLAVPDPYCKPGQTGP